MAYDEDGSPVEPEWPEADVIIGNPPFLGDRKMRRELGDDYVGDLRELFAGRLPGSSDLVCYWFEKARFMIDERPASRAGLIATQAIRGGSNRAVLERVLSTGSVFWAESDRNWILDGATVHVSMVGFDDGSETRRVLDGERVSQINPDLTSGPDLSRAQTLSENRDLSFIGVQRSGPFDISDELAQTMLADTGNPNGRPNSEVVRAWINALDVVRRPRHMWIIDFGVDTPMEDAAQYQGPFEYVRTAVKPKRETMGTAALLDKWWLHWRPRPAMRHAINGLDRFIATPMVAKHRLFVWVSVGVVPESLLVVVARADDYFFGVLHSAPHELWSRATGSQLRDATSGQRYTPSSTFAAFPFPWPPGSEPGHDPRVMGFR